MKRYSTVVVEDDLQVREVLVETMRFTDFEAVGYDEAEKLLYALDQLTLFPKNGPDRIEPRRRFLLRTFPSSILAVGCIASYPAVVSTRVGPPKPYGPTPS